MDQTSRQCWVSPTPAGLALRHALPAHIRIAVYDVLLPLTPANANPILVPQPPPHLPSLFPPSAHQDIRARPPSTYIGSVPFRLALPPAAQDGAPPPRPAEREVVRPRSKPLLYALSSTSYPLINFAPPPRPGSLANGSFLLSEDVPEQDQLLPYLLDPPAEDMVPAPTGETGLIDPAPTPKSAKRNWLKWAFAPLLGFLLGATGLAGYLRYRKAVKQSTTPVDEKTPLLIAAEKDTPELPAKAEKSVTIIEPNSSAVPVKPGSPLAEDDATPKKKASNRRRVRGRKKKTGASRDGEGEDDEEDEDGTASPPASVKKDDKPLPELPREISSTALSDMDDKERLAISDTIIGELISTVVLRKLTSRLRLARNGGTEGYMGWPACRCQAVTERLHTTRIARGQAVASE